MRRHDLSMCSSALSGSTPCRRREGGARDVLAAERFDQRLFVHRGVAAVDEDGAFFMALNCFSLIRVSPFSGACMDRKSARWHSLMRLGRA
jgi:hypothetical protein